MIVTEKHTACAYQIRDLVDYPEKITLVIDNLNTRALLYKTFAPQEAQQILDKLEFCYPLSMGVG